ncbi:MAG TPA: FAD-linked oxidase C-terminal domain-containing protein [Bacteroidales bacterium]|nr:FAD-linked oxidase C-terminal domain-containing protein [Bacteroidales bacterium]
MTSNFSTERIASLRRSLQGELFTDESQRLLYATDASAYREVPMGVARPRNAQDIRTLILFSAETGIPLIPRTAGTSLAGQVVGNGLVVDVSRYMTKILEFDTENHRVRVQPGVILDELNREAEKHGLFFGPETSTSSRCMIGGMVGNNSCGAHSILYGSTRDHLVSIKGYLSDGSEVEFKAVDREEFDRKCRGDSLESRIYRQIRDMLSDPANRDAIRKDFPDPALHRRNTGYAIDLLLDNEIFSGTDDSHMQAADVPSPLSFNFCRLVAGSEGTLMFMTEITLNLVPLPPKEKGLICLHCGTVEEALQANLVALKYEPGSVELMDKPIMDCTLGNITQRRNRFFIEGDPGAILIIEFARQTRDEIIRIHRELEAEMRAAGLGYHFPLIFPPDVKKVWDLRKAGLGVLSNYPGDRKPVPVIEDTAVSPAVLPAYIADLKEMLKRLGLDCVYYAHIGSGELHLRPVLNLKDPADVELFHTVAYETARLVKKYNGSLSGEHGDGRLRGEFIPFMLGEYNYWLIKEIKSLWDPLRIFNPGKITDTPAMNSHLRFTPGRAAREIPTIFDFSASHGILRAAEQCNGSGDCRNTIVTGGTMCPSYKALLDENTTTRARANILREFLTRSDKSNPFDHKEIYEVMDLCLSCKACKSECPSNVDMTRLKAEFLHHWHEAHGIPLRTRMIAYITRINQLGMIAPALFNFFVSHKWLSGWVKKGLGFARKRSIPRLSPVTLRRRVKAMGQDRSLPGLVYLFADEFTNYNEPEIGVKAVKILNRLGYRVVIPAHGESGRTFLSKGLLRKAKKLANRNVGQLKDLITGETPLIGLEPSAILTFRDEYPDLVDAGLKAEAKKLAQNALLFEEFIAKITSLPAAAAGNPENVGDLFTSEPRRILLHGHCHQKALASVEPTKKMLSLPANYKVEEIRSGCCGMAGSFGYEEEHFDVAMKIGEQVLFPEVRNAGQDTIIAAPGTSCRHHIADGTGRAALHPVEVLFGALRID